MILSIGITLSATYYPGLVAIYIKDIGEKNSHENNCIYDCATEV